MKQRINDLIWKLPRPIHTLIQKLTGWVMVEVQVYHDFRIHETSIMPDGSHVVGGQAEKVTTEHVWDNSGEYGPKHDWK